MATSRSDPSPPQREDDTNAITDAAHIGGPPGLDLLKLCQDADTVSKQFHARHLTQPLAQSYRAWRNEHSTTSKYLGPGFRGRSRLFVPKTRSAVRKNMAGAAAALFSTEDVANVSAVYEDDKSQLAIAGVKKELLNFRLTRGFTPTSINWLLIATGGMQDAQLTGVTISKQYWDYQTRDTLEMENVTEDGFDPETGEPGPQPVIDEETGLIKQRPVQRVVYDRPMVDLLPIENISLDPAAPWWDPVGMGAWFFARYPMYLADVKAMMRSGTKPGQESIWLDPESVNFGKGSTGPDERSGTRRAREGGADRFEQVRSGGDLAIVWIVERFIRYEGRSLHFWTVGDQEFISIVSDVEEVYPAHKGERPYKMGVAGIETHRIVPMSPVESWQPLQLELNDITNLRLDTVKRSIAPFTIIKRGAKVDLNQVNKRGQPEAFLQVNDVNEDVRFQETPGPNGAAFNETSVTNAAFDELAGSFSTSSVQSSRQLNETVGGMQLLNGAANAVSEFDLRVWVETWAEPVLRQVMALIDYFESDQTAMLVAGAKAQAFSRYQHSPTINDLESAEVTVRCNIGIGSADPMQKLAKMKAAGDLLVPYMPLMEKQGIEPNMETIIEEAYGHAGFKDGRRFYKFGQPPPPAAPEAPPPDPLAEGKLELAKDQLAFQKDKAKDDTKAKVAIEVLRQRKDMATHLTGLQADALARRDQRTSRMGEIFANRDNGGSAAKRPGGSGSAPQAQQPQPPMQQILPPQRGPDPATAAIAQQLTELQRQSAAERQMLIQMMMQLGKALETMNAPKQFVRDQGGQIVGMAPMAAP